MNKELLLQQIYQDFPSLKKQDLGSLLSANLLASHQLNLPRSLLIQAKAIVKNLFEFRQSPAYLNFKKPNYRFNNFEQQAHSSVFMSYDFHVNEDNQLKLIEINTNAGFMLLSYYMYKAWNLDFAIQDFKLEDIKSHFENDYKSFCLANSIEAKKHNLKIAIVDEKPEQQKLYLEFLIFQALFAKWGWQLDILDPQQDLSKYDMVYNRHTDFYFENAISKQMRDLYLANKVCITPHPKEYYLLADKQDLIDWSSDELPAHLKELLSEATKMSLLQSFSLNLQNKDELWLKRKKLFLKPKASCGSKQAYRGESISRKLYEQMAAQENSYIAQSYCAAPELKFKESEQASLNAAEKSLKYDLRFYVYQDQIFFAAARLYQGQVTNSQTEGGGFAPIVFST